MAPFGVFGLFFSVARAGGVLVESLASKVQVVVYLNPELKPAERAALVARIKAQPVVKTVEERTSEEALARFKGLFPDLAAIPEEIGETPFPPSVEVSLKPDLAKTAGRGVLFIAGAKAYFILAGFAVQFVLPRLLTDAAFGLFWTAMNLVSIVNNVLIAATVQSVSKMVSEDDRLGDPRNGRNRGFWILPGHRQERCGRHSVVGRGSKDDLP